MRSLLIACALMFATPVLADGSSTRLSDGTLDTAVQLREQALAGSGAWEMVESLTTEVGPRLAGSEADARAVAWALKTFGTLGFDRVYTEPVRFPVWRRGHEIARVVSPFPQPLHLAALGLSVGTGDTPIEAEVVEFASLAELEASPENSLQGKIAYVSERMQRSHDASGYGAVVATRSRGPSAASRLGARAFLLRSIGTDNNRTPHTGMQRYADDVRPIPAAALSNPDADLLSNMLRRDQPVVLYLDIDVGLGEEYESANVIAELRGRERPDEVIVLGAHLDSWDMGTGALDDAAGIAITARAAALIAALGQRPRRTIRVVAFANEEQGLVGGRAYAKAHAAEIEQHIIGAESDLGAGRIYAFSTSKAPPQAEGVIEQIAQVLAPLGIKHTPGEGSVGPDLIPMMQHGMAWASLAQDGTDYFDYHHTHNDTLDKVDAKALDQNVAAYAVFAWLAAEAQVSFGSAALPAADPN